VHYAKHVRYNGLARSSTRRPDTADQLVELIRSVVDIVRQAATDLELMTVAQ
jgi:hypothetical protein